MSHPESPPVRRRWPLQLGLVVLLLTVAVAGTLIMMNSAPKAVRKPAEKTARLVEVMPVRMGDHVADIAAMGRVVAASEATLYPEVAGRITEVHERFVPGEQVQAGEELLRLDDADYRLTVRQRRSALAQAEATLAREQGQQQVARREYEMLGEQMAANERSLVLREPQLASAKATREDALAALDRARLDLTRTVVKAPFDGIITEKSVALGTRVSNTSPLLTLVATERFWVRVDLPVEALHQITVPNGSEEVGSIVKLRRGDWPQGIYREGRVLRLNPRLDEQARMAQVLVEVHDPLAQLPEHRGLPRLLINDYVEATITGRTLQETVALDRALLRGGNRVWLLENGELVIRPVEVVFRGREQVFLRGDLQTGDRVVSTDLSSPVAGMALRTSKTAGALAEGEADE
ncbi:efflux RND transporter periplasmic adaptor subunit [Thiohalomonas denitrificans]|uniref:RND family efflux transporter, MFP subunit n=1 Tax=Thiohalomonas denitrificans TaxID=415747 RepID=A0A1G5PQS7_9GAMM|nr:efflux RND transporter periplasmic adaptor subunit [Thiohalomonas denitrificans]SCZ51782.1 RND family efflux transporter, MFP subunit [Thiohalomonas denitrificans]